MSLLSKKKLLVFVVIFVMSLFLSHPTFATDSSTVVETTFFGNINDEGDGCGVFTILNLVVDILSIGVGILGVIGISVAGIQYLTSAGKEDQARRSRVRIFQIIIGLAVYAIMYTGINWLTPGGKLNTGSSCSTLTNEQLAKMKAAEQKASNNTSSNKSSNKSTNKSNAKGDPTCLKKAAKVVKEAGICEAKTKAERIARTAELLAWPAGTSSSKYKDRNGDAKKITSWSQVKKGYPNNAFKSAFDEVYPKHFLKSESWQSQKKKFGNGPIIGAACNTFAAVVLKASGNVSATSGREYQLTNLMGGKYYKKVKGSLKRGDICHRSDSHWMIILKRKNGRYITAEAGNGSNYFGRIMTNSHSGCQYYRVVE